MNAKVQEKEMAVKLRRDGYSYNDILGVVSVAKSTLSNWLKDLPLTENEKKMLLLKQIKTWALESYH